MRRFALVPSLLLGILSLFAFVAPAAAGDFRGANTVTVAEGETIDDDLYVGAGTVSIGGTIEGDATIAGGTVTVTGTVNGSLNVGGGSVDVLGEVTGAVRVSGGTVRIAGSVGRDVVVFGGSVTIEPDAEVGGDVAGGVGTLTVGGTIGGDVLAGARTLRVAGTIEGGIDAAVGDLIIEGDASVGGNVTYTSDREAQIADTAQIGGSVERREPAPGTGGGDGAESIPGATTILAFLGVLVGMLIFGWTFLAIRPRLVLGSGELLRTRPLPALGFGVLAWVGQFVLVVFLLLCAVLFTILAGAIGGAFVFAAVALILLIIVLLIVSSVPVAMAIGGLILRGDRSPYLAYLVGAVTLATIGVLAGLVPALGGLVALAIWILGLGAFVLYLMRTRTVPWTYGAPPTAASEGPWPTPAAPGG